MCRGWVCEHVNVCIHESVSAHVCVYTGMRCVCMCVCLCVCVGGGRGGRERER